MKEKILYTKYSNDRAEEFQIMTQIVERNGEKVVRKSATCDKAIQHIRRMLESEKKLEDSFSGTHFKANRILASTEKSVDFEFIEGKSYDILLDEYLKNKDMHGFISAVNDFFSELDKLAVESFSETESTKTVFGPKVFADGEKSIPFGNIDMIFQNVIISDSKVWNVIDYEWTFDFAIPVKLIKCRALLIYFFSSSRRLPLFNEKLLNSVNLTKQDFENAKRIDQNEFTNFVQHNHIILPKFSESLRKPVINPYVLEQQDYIDIFYDTGNGFSEAEKDVIYQFPVTVHPHENLRALRIDPSARHCMVSDILVETNGKKLAFTTNAYREDSGIFFFDTADPQIYVDIENFSFDTISLNMNVATLSVEQSKSIKEQYTRSVNQQLTIEGQCSTIENQRNMIESLKQYLQEQAEKTDIIIQQKQDELRSLQNSRSWRLTKPFRLIGKSLRRIFSRGD